MDMKAQRIVCACNRKGKIRIYGARHMDDCMRGQIRLLWPFKVFFGIRSIWGGWEQGFIYNFGEFLTRTEAWYVALDARQILYRCGGDTTDGGTLYSENLY